MASRQSSSFPNGAVRKVAGLMTSHVPPLTRSAGYRLADALVRGSILRSCEQPETHCAGILIDPRSDEAERSRIPDFVEHCGEPEFFPQAPGVGTRAGKVGGARYLSCPVRPRHNTAGKLRTSSCTTGRMARGTKRICKKGPAPCGCDGLVLIMKCQPWRPWDTRRAVLRHAPPTTHFLHRAGIPD